MNLSELNADKVIPAALKAVLINGFESSSYKDWQEFIEEWNGEDFQEDEYDIDSYSGAWEALYYVNAETWYDFAGDLKVRVAQPPMRGTSGDHDEYYVVFAITDGVDTRYFKRLGWYSSYDGGTLTEADDFEVFPQEVTTTEWFRK